jgi:hypothetical protein
MRAEYPDWRAARTAMCAHVRAHKVDSGRDPKTRALREEARRRQADAWDEGPLRKKIKYG